MSGVFSFLMTSIDGYFTGPEERIDWHNAGAPEFEDFAVEQLDSADALLFGRRTYELLSAFWSSPAAFRDAPGTARRMNDLPKYVVSRTWEKADWPTTTVIALDDVAGVKQGRTIMVCGSSELTARLLDAGLLDELRVMVNPVVLGAGRSVVGGAKRVGMRLAETRVFEDGNVLLMYTRR